MDDILVGILLSNKPNSLKKELVIAIANHGKSNLCFEVFKKMTLKCLSILYPHYDHDDEKPSLLGFQDDLNENLLNLVMKTWIANNEQHMAEFLLKMCIESLNTHPVSYQIIHLKKTLFLLKYYYSIPVSFRTNIVKMDHCIRQYLYGCLLCCIDIEVMGLICKGFMTHKVLLPQSMSQNELSDVLHIFVKVFSITSLQQLIKTKKDHHFIDNMFFTILKNDIQNGVVFFANHIFERLSKEEMQCSPCVAKLLVHIKLEMLFSSFDHLMSMNLPDDTQVRILNTMVDWIIIPDPNIGADQWIIHYMKCLLKYRKFHVLIVVTEFKIKEIFNLIQFAPLRKNAVSLVMFMLLNYLHSPKAFHKVCGIIPKIMEDLKKENEDGSFLKVIVEMTYTLMYHFPGYPDIYSPLLLCMKEYPKPEEASMKLYLKASLSTRYSDDTSFMITRERKSDTGKVGLNNLGNTCYANSIIQALFNLPRVKKTVLGNDSQDSKRNPLFKSLQELFALLYLSKRPSITPTSFLNLSRPTWFQKGFQQDCSEYLKFLLDKIQIECLADESCCDINKHFTGKLSTNVRCLNCNSLSCGTELFNDLPLSFSEHYEASSDHTLKGGDPPNTFKQTIDFGMHAETIEEIIETEDGNTIHPSAGGDDGGDSGGGSIITTNYSIITMLERYFTPEILRECNQYFCEKCASLQNATKTIEILEFPEYLVLTIKRFTYNIFAKKRSKLLHVVKHPETLTLCGGCTSCRLDKNEKPENSFSTNNTMSKCTNSQKYKLLSLVVHSGFSSDSGHYYSFNCEYESGGGVNKYFLMNDCRVTFSSQESISQLADFFPNDTPYIYIYGKTCEENEQNDFQVHRRLVDYVHNEDDKYELELQSDEIRRNKSFLSNRKNGGDDDNNGTFGGGGASCGGSSFNDFNGGRFIF